MAAQDEAANGTRLPESRKTDRSAILLEVLRNIVFFALIASIAWVLLAGGAPLSNGALCIHRPAEG